MHWSYGVMTALHADSPGGSGPSTLIACATSSFVAAGPSSSQAERARILELTRTSHSSVTRYFSAAHVVPVGSEGISRPIDDAPRFTPDSTLTALAQLGSFRLDCEATRSTTLSHDKPPAARDGLYLGFRVLELDFGVCPQTIQIFTTNGMKVDTANMSADQTHYVIRDFCADPTYSSRPYVTGFPYMRSFAEVPLTSPSGFVIGTFCVIDNKPRAFDDEEKVMLGEVASTIMNHLELLKSRMDLDRANRLVRGLGSYVDGYSGLQEQQTMSLAAMSTSPSVALSFSPTSPDLRHENSDTNQSASSASVDSTSYGFTSPVSEIESAIESFGLQEPLLPDPKNGVECAEDRSSVSRGVRATLSRAGNLIRQAMNLQGVVFLDAYAQGFRDRNVANVRGSATGQRAASASASQRCTLLGRSITSENDSDTTAATTELFNIGEDWLQRMLASFPNGNTYSYDAMGVVQNRHINTKDGHELHPSRQTLGAPRLGDISADEHNELAADLSHAIKDARSIIFLPMWNFQKDQWFAAAVGWTTDPVRVLDSGELNYLSAFGNSIMAEVSKIETLAVSQAKSDFISSISHELRSPLHGVLAATELLRESEQSASQLGMLDSIDVCGTILLDTLNHLLDYAKISNIDPRKRLNFNSQSSQSQQDELLRLSVVDLGQLVQDVVEGVHLGSSVRYSFRDDPHGQVNDLINSENGVSDLDEHATSTSGTVLILVDVDPSVNWRFETESGAWKRIIMNLCGNSIKYTDRGTITVKLSRSSQVLEIDGDTKVVQQICLQVDDTGQGISMDYLKHHLFSPFAQENGLSVGTGLGLSIVHQLVESLDGRIEVQSQKDVGTQISVVIPIGPRTQERSTQLGSNQVPGAQPQFLDKSLQGRKLYLAPVIECHEINNADKDYRSNPRSTVNASAAARKLLAKIAEQWFGINVISINELPDDSRTERDAVFILSPLRSSGDKDGLDWMLKMRGLPSDLHATSVLVSHPLTPKRLFAFFSRVLKSIRTAPVSAQPSENPQLHNVEMPERKKENVPPLHPEMQPASDLLPQPESSTRATWNAQQFNILIVDDNPINLKVLATCLKRLGCLYTECVNGQKAVEAHQSSLIVFDLVLMDLSMPIMDGFAATRAIRAHEIASKLSRTRIVALTALGSSDAQTEAFASGVDMFLSKPVRMADVRSLVDELRIAQDAGLMGNGLPGKTVSLPLDTGITQKS
nr:sensor protein gacs [Quercus suber]